MKRAFCQAFSLQEIFSTNVENSKDNENHRTRHNLLHFPTATFLGEDGGRNVMGDRLD
jgi:hypothetical protein